MRATVKFDLPAEWRELQQHLTRLDAVAVLWEIDLQTIGGLMRATVEFDLPEEWDDLRQHLSGPDAVSVLWDIDQHLRGIIKHGPGGHIADALQGVRDLLQQSCSERGITLD